MIRLLRQRLQEFSLRRRYRLAQRKIRVIESLRLPEDLKLAAIARAMRSFEETLDQYVRDH